MERLLLEEKCLLMEKLFPIGLDNLAKAFRVFQGLHSLEMALIALLECALLLQGKVL